MLKQRSSSRPSTGRKNGAEGEGGMKGIAARNGESGESEKIQGTRRQKYERRHKNDARILIKVLKKLASVSASLFVPRIFQTVGLVQR